MWSPAYVLYLAYYFKSTNYRKLIPAMRWVHQNLGAGYLKLGLDMLSCSCRYAVSFEDYYWHRFFELPESDRSSFAGTGVSHRFFTLMNDRKKTAIFRSKARFSKHFGNLMGRQSLSLKECSLAQFSEWVKARPIIVVKPDYGSSGYGIEFIKTTGMEPAKLYATLLRQGQDIVEEPIEQHEALQRLNPSCVNTIRVITVRTDTRVDIIGTILKIGVGGSKVDNMNSGGIAAAVDPVTGRLIGPAISISVWNPRYAVHPDTKIPIPGFQVPLWDSVLSLACTAAQIVPTVRTVGWDIAVTSEDAILVEGNDNWGAAFWQKTAGSGQIDVLRRYANV